MVTVMNNQGMMMGPMKGHLAPNSSPFKPTINKLSSQYMIQDHMSSHYIKLGTAKSAIDNKPPKSMTTSVKKRDQMRREAMAKQMKLFDFEKEMKHSGSLSNQMRDSDVYGSPRLLSVTVTKTGYDEMRPRSSSSFHSQHRSKSGYSPRSSTTSNPNSPRNKSQKSDILNQTYSGDYLDRHEERFKNTDTPFTPRLKKRSGKSYLSNSKHYAPPLVIKKENKRKIATKSHESKEDNVSPVASYSDLRSAQDKTPNREHERRWVEEQTDLMQRLTLDESKRTYDNIYPSQARSDTFAKNETKNRIQAEEEEMKYLEFINGVTNDILTRGIYSDRVLTQVMQRHLDQNCSRLNESRMRHMLMKLQEDLGVSADISSRGFRSTSAYSSGYEGSSYNRSPSPESKANQGSLRSASWKSDASSRSGRLSFSETKQSSKPPVSASSGSPSIRSSVKRQKGILKTPGTSSGSDLEAKSTAFSSGDEDDKRVKKKVSVERLPSTSLEENPDKPKENHNKSIHSDIETNEASRPVPAKRSSIVSTSGSHIAESVDAEKNKKIVTEDNAVTNEKGSVENITAVTRQEDGLGLADSDLDDF
uniref:spermatogenesis-associated protein 7 homolog isoform X3 n=1 Tax=Styela clava TaxID=7725 RepID=UPI001939609D|nr:spermatogenesis-associated protein 7 homolog isoform X3 [Styela clava]